MHIRCQRQFRRALPLHLDREYQGSPCHRASHPALHFWELRIFHTHPRHSPGPHRQSDLPRRPLERWLWTAAFQDSVAMCSVPAVQDFAPILRPPFPLSLHHLPCESIGERCPAFLPPIDSNFNDRIQHKQTENNPSTSEDDRENAANYLDDRSCVVFDFER